MYSHYLCRYKPAVTSLVHSHSGVPYPQARSYKRLVLPRPNETDVHECISSGRQKCESHKRKDLGCTEDVEVFPSKISEAYPSPDWLYGDGRYHAKG